MSTIKAKNIKQTVVGTTIQPLKIGGILEDGSDAVITIDTNKVLSGVAVNYTATIPYTSWSEITSTNNGSYWVKEVTVSGILSTDKPDVTLQLTGTKATDLIRIANYSSLFRCVAGNGFLTFHTFSVPSADIPIDIRVIR